MLANQAIKNNEKIDNVITKLTCIEPYENKWLEKNEIEVIRQKVEEVDIKIFNDLNTDDENTNSDISKLNFENETSFDEFKRKVIKYGEISNFPKLD